MSIARRIPVFVTLFAAAVACLPVSDAAAQARRRAESEGDSARTFRELERGVLAELNRARENPREFAEMLDTIAGWYEGKLLRRPGAGIVFETVEGAPAVHEAARVLRRMAALPAFDRSEGLALAARDHVRDQGPPGRMGHRGSDGSTTSDRAERYGKWNFVLSENIAYGPLDARGMVVGLIVDDGVPDRGHRLNIYDARVRVAGVSCGPHRVYGRMCVIVHAGGYSDAPQRADGGTR